MDVEEKHHSYLHLHWQQLQEGIRKNHLGTCTDIDTGQHAKLFATGEVLTPPPSCSQGPARTRERYNNVFEGSITATF